MQSYQTIQIYKITFLCSWVKQKTKTKIFYNKKKEK